MRLHLDMSYGRDREPKESLGLALELACTWMDALKADADTFDFAYRMAFYRDKKLISDWRDKVEQHEKEMTEFALGAIKRSIAADAKASAAPKPSRPAP